MQFKDFGKKDDTDKPDWTLIPWSALKKVVRVLDFGAVKYAPNAWQSVPDAKHRYLAAAFRHLAAYADGQRYDEESGLHSLSHAVCCLLFIIWFDDSSDGSGMATDNGQAGKIGDPKCRQCGGVMRSGQAMEQTFVGGIPDFPDDKFSMTRSAGDPGKLVDCLKCCECGCR